MENPADWNALSPLEKAHQLSEAAAQARRDGRDQMACALYLQSLNLYRGRDDKPNIARTLLRLGYLAGWADFGDGLDMFSRFRTYGGEALALCRELGDKGGAAEALCLLARSAARPEADALLAEALALAQESGDRARQAHVLSVLGAQAAVTGDQKGRAAAAGGPTPAKTLQEQALALYREIGDKAGVAHSLFSLSIRAEKPQKQAYLEEALALQRELGNKKRIVEILQMLDMYSEPTDYARREAWNREALALCREMGSPIWEAGCLRRLAEIARSQGDEAKASALEAEGKAVYPAPEHDPEGMKALEAAFEKGDQDAAKEVLKQMFGGKPGKAARPEP
jgi:hypothetical protein